MSESPWMDTREAAAYLGISVDSLHRLTSNQAIRHTKVHAHALRFHRLDLDAFMRERTVEPAAS
jgi:excisionase family DNA binding protein